MLKILLHDTLPDAGPISIPHQMLDAPRMVGFITRSEILLRCSEDLERNPLSCLVTAWNKGAI